MALKQDDDDDEVVVDYGYGSDDDDDDGDEDDDDIVYLRDISASSQHRDLDREMRAADRLSIRLLAVEDNEEEENRLLRKSLRLATVFSKNTAHDHDNDDDNDDDDNYQYDNNTNRMLLERKRMDGTDRSPRASTKDGMKARKQVWTMVFGAITGLVMVITGIILMRHVTGPPYQPVGPYTLIECQSGDDFFQYYNFYDGPDSVGSNGYNQYVNHEHAINRGILNVTEEVDDIYDAETRSFVYMGSASTNAGPRDSIRLEGTRRFNRGLFM